MRASGRSEGRSRGATTCCCEGEDAFRASRSLRRRVPAGGGRGGLRLRRHFRRRAARRARLARREEPPSSAPGLGRRAALLDARDDPGVRARAARVGRRAGGLRASGTRSGSPTRPSGSTPSRAQATTRPFSRAVDDEYPNVREAIAFARKARDGELLLRLATALWGFWSSRVYGAEGRRALEEALELSGRRPARTLLGLCTLRMLSGSSGEQLSEARRGGARGVRGAGRRLQPRPGLEPRRPRRGNRDGLAGNRRGRLEAGALVRAPRQLPGRARPRASPG